MRNNLDLQLQLQESSQESFKMDQDYRNGPGANADVTRDWISAFNTSLLTTRAASLAGENQDQTQGLPALMQSPEFASLLIAAQHLSRSLGITKEDATERLINTFRSLDSAWTQVVIKRGIQAMID